MLHSPHPHRLCCNHIIASWAVGPCTGARGRSSTARLCALTGLSADRLSSPAATAPARCRVTSAEESTGVALPSTEGTAALARVCARSGCAGTRTTARARARACRAPPRCSRRSWTRCCGTPSAPHRTALPPLRTAPSNRLCLSCMLAAPTRAAATSSWFWPFWSRRRGSRSLRTCAGTYRSACDAAGRMRESRTHSHDQCVCDLMRCSGEPPLTQACSSQQELSWNVRMGTPTRTAAMTAACPPPSVSSASCTGACNVVS